MGRFERDSGVVGSQQRRVSCGDAGFGGPDGGCSLLGLTGREAGGQGMARMRLKASANCCAQDEVWGIRRSSMREWLTRRQQPVAQRSRLRGDQRPVEQQQPRPAQHVDRDRGHDHPGGVDRERALRPCSQAGGRGAADESLHAGVHAVGHLEPLDLPAWAAGGDHLIPVAAPLLKQRQLGAGLDLLDTYDT